MAPIEEVSFAKLVLTEHPRVPGRYMKVEPMTWLIICGAGAIILIVGLASDDAAVTGAFSRLRGHRTSQLKATVATAPGFPAR